MACNGEKNVKIKKVRHEERCEVCRKTFIGKKMWTTKVFAPIVFGDSVQRFYCTKCCPTSKSVLAIAQKLENKRHKLPPIDE